MAQGRNEGRASMLMVAQSSRIGSSAIVYSSDLVLITADWMSRPEWNRLMLLSRLGPGDEFTNTREPPRDRLDLLCRRIYRD